MQKLWVTFTACKQLFSYGLMVPWSVCSLCLQLLQYYVYSNGDPCQPNENKTESTNTDVNWFVLTIHAYYRYISLFLLFSCQYTACWKLLFHVLSICYMIHDRYLYFFIYSDVLMLKEFFTPCSIPPIPLPTSYLLRK